MTTKTTVSYTDGNRNFQVEYTDWSEEELSIVKNIKVEKLSYPYEGWITSADRTKLMHWQNKECHRDDGPAIIEATGDRVWCQNGKRHRDGDLPAYIGKLFNQHCWYQQGKLHREGNKPSIISMNKDNVVICEQYFCQGKRHRINGPAKEFSLFSKKQDRQDRDPLSDEYWIHGHPLTQVQFELLTTSELIEQWVQECLKVEPPGCYQCKS